MPFFFSFFFLHARSYIYMQYVFLRVCGWHELTKLVSQEEKNYTLHTLTENIFMRCLCVFIGTCFFFMCVGRAAAAVYGTVLGQNSSSAAT